MHALCSTYSTCACLALVWFLCSHPFFRLTLLFLTKKILQDLGSPESAAQRLLDQYLNKEFMSTRLGIRREGEVVSATERQGGDGRTYYDLDIRMASYGSR